MGFLDSIITDWGDKSATPLFRLRLEKAAKNWVVQKSAVVTASLAKGEIGLTEAAHQIEHLNTIARSKVSHALQGRPKNAADKAASSGRLPVDKPKESQ